MHSNIRRMDKANGGKHNFRLFIKINWNIQIIRFTVTNHLFTRLEFSNSEIKTLINRFGMSKASNGAIRCIKKGTAYIAENTISKIVNTKCHENQLPDLLVSSLMLSQ